MQLNKTTGAALENVRSKFESAPAAQNIQSGKTSAQTAKTSAPAPPVLPRSVSSLISSCGLPADKLSASIISFARFFSLPLKPDLMQDIRRQAFASTASTTPEASKSDAVKQAAQNASDSDAIAKNREALSLSAAAAESKGLELQAKGLHEFAQAVDPDLRRRQDEGRGKRGRQNKDDNDSEEKAPQKTETVGASALKKLALESAEKNPLLCVLNKLPGKDGRRWIVLPFNFSENGREFFVSLRILLESANAPGRAVCMALDVAESGESENSLSANSAPERRWLFVLEAANGPADRLAVYTQPELSTENRTALARELSSLLEIKPERVCVNNKTENFPCESRGGDELLRSINEAV
jgi:hypothetical protein